MELVSSTTSETSTSGVAPRYLLLHIFIVINIPPLLLVDVFLLIFIDDICFRVLHVVFHQVTVVHNGGLDHYDVMMFVYTEESIVVLVLYRLQDLLCPQNNSILFRYFANLYFTSILGSELV